MFITRDYEQNFIDYEGKVECYDGLTSSLCEKLRNEVCDDDTLLDFFDNHAEGLGLQIMDDHVDETTLYLFIKENYHGIVAWCKKAGDGERKDSAFWGAEPSGLPDGWWKQEGGEA